MKKLKGKVQHLQNELIRVSWGLGGQRTWGTEVGVCREASGSRRGKDLEGWEPPMQDSAEGPGVRPLGQG